MNFNFQVSGMTCGGCEAKVTGLQKTMTSIQSAQADWQAGEIKLEAEANATVVSLKKAIEGLGFKVLSFVKES